MSTQGEDCTCSPRLGGHYLNCPVLQPLTCHRCGKPGYLDLCDVQTWAEPEPTYLPGKGGWCTTPGCMEPNGSRLIKPHGARV